jgi:hypothetical protein
VFVHTCFSCFISLIDFPFWFFLLTDVREPSALEDLLLSLDAMQADWTASLQQHWQIAIDALARDTLAAGRPVRQNVWSK